MRPIASLALLGLILQPARAMQAGAGEKLFLAHCAACHGRRGEGGRGVRLTPATRAATDDALFTIIKKGIPGSEMPAAPLGDAEIQEVLAFVRTLQSSGADDRILSPARSPGEQIYRASGCSACHFIATEGGVLGPDLTNIGAQRSPDYLRRALLEPEADIPNSFGQYRWYTVIPDNFLQVRVTAADGRQITAARLNEDAFSIQLRDASGRVYSFWKSELTELHKDWGKSPMPSYREKLSTAGIDELIKYLSSLRGAR